MLCIYGYYLNNQNPFEISSGPGYSSPSERTQSNLLFLGAKEISNDTGILQPKYVTSRAYKWPNAYWRYVSIMWSCVHPLSVMEVEKNEIVCTAVT
jgi:hypothetical protein